MATQLHHRKLMFNDGIDDDDEQVCAQPCDPAWDHTSFICPLQCFDVCPSICNDDVANNPPAEAGGPKSAVFIVTFLPLMMTIVLIWGCLSIYRWSSQEPQQPPLPHELYGGEFDHRRWYVRTTGGLHSSVINAIGIRRYKKEEGALEESECAVCLSEFEEDEILRMLPNCKHGFHVPCIDTWLKSNTNCPVCRAGVEISTENSDVAPPVPLGIPVNNGGEREDSRVHECMSGVNYKEDESTEQNVVPKNNIIVQHS